MDRPPESLRLWQMCAALEWNHLPVAGGLYDQSARLLDEWVAIWNVKADVDKEKEEKRKRDERMKKLQAKQ